MENERWHKVEEIFERAVDLPPAERALYLARRCGNDRDLQREVEEMIDADRLSNNFIESPVIASSTLSNLLPTIEDSVPPDFIGLRVGAYQLIRELGRGGMGAVFLARRADSAFEKQVAVKLIKRGMDTDFILKRFRNERQILATLDHPNIGRLLDGGTTSDGLPYFVMEYIDGVPINQYCDLNKLSIRERLKLFQKVCSAVGYAHRNLIIHRDLKPGNILVTEDGTPKLLDFGIAKLLDPALAVDSVSPTLTGMRLMTPEYASPEQIRGEKLTPASDIYSLGVLLYELLTGNRPYKFVSRAPHDIARVICEEEPLNPALAINAYDAENADEKLRIVSGNRSLSAEELQKELSGDLRRILLEAMLKSPLNRYGSVEDFSNDIQAYLDGSPLAASDSHFDTGDRFDDSLPPIESLAVLPFRSFYLKDASQDAPDTGDFLSLGLADALITHLGNLKTLSVRPTSSILKYARSGIMPEPEQAGRELDVTYILDGTVQQIKNRVRLTAQLVRVRNNETVWAGQFDEQSDDILSLQDSISAQIAQALTTQLTGEERERMEKRGTNNPKAYQAYLRGRYFYHVYTVESLAKALVCFYEAIALDAHFALPYCGIADYYIFLSIFAVMSPQESFPAAKQAALTALELDPDLAEAHISLGIIAYGFDWDFEQSEKHLKRALELNPNSSQAHLWYGMLLNLKGKHDHAVRAMRRAEKLNPQSPSMFVSFAFCLRNARRFEESLNKLRRALAIQPNNSTALASYCWVVRSLKNYDEAEKACRKAVELTQRESMPLFGLAHTLAVVGKSEEAAKIAGELERRRDKQYVPPIYIAQIYAALGEIDEAFEWLEQAFADHDFWTVWFPLNPSFDALKSDPRYAGYVRRISPAAVENAVEAIHQSHIDTKILPNGAFESAPGDIASLPLPQTRRAPVFASIAGLTIFILFGLAISGWKYDFIKIVQPGEQTISDSALNRITTADPKQKAIAVLPFVTDLHVEDEKSLAAGLAESLYRKLGQIKELSVRPAMLNIEQNQTPQQIGASFGVAYLLRGSLEKTDEEIQVAAELIDTKTGKIIWAEKFDEKTADFPTVQVAIAERVLSALTVQLTAAERRQINKSYTENSDAYQLYLAGRYKMANRSAANLHAAIATFEQSRDKDPNFPLAYAGLADAYALLNLYEIPPTPGVYAKAKANAEKALALDNNLAEAHASLAYILFYGDRNRAAAEINFKRALELNPSYSTAYHWYGLALAALGKHDEAIANINKAIELEPRSAIVHSAAGLIYWYARRYEEALNITRGSLEIDAGFVPGHKTLRIIYSTIGDYERALEAYRQERIYVGNTDEKEPGWMMLAAQVEAAGGNREKAAALLKTATGSAIIRNNPSAYAYETAVAYAMTGDADAAFEWLKKADASRAHGFNFVLVDPRFDAFRHDSRFEHLSKAFD